MTEPRKIDGLKQILDVPREQYGGADNGDWLYGLSPSDLLTPKGLAKLERKVERATLGLEPDDD